MYRLLVLISIPKVPITTPNNVLTVSLAFFSDLEFVLSLQY